MHNVGKKTVHSKLSLFIINGVSMKIHFGQYLSIPKTNDQPLLTLKPCGVN